MRVGDPPGGARPRDRPVQRAARAATARPDRSSQVSGRNRHPRLPAGRGEPVRTLHVGLRVADPGRSLAFYTAYTALGYQVAGSVPETPLRRLTMLKLAGTSSSPSNSSTIRRKARSAS